MSKSFRFQENLYNTYKMLKTKKSRQEFLEKCVLFAFENLEFQSNYDVEIAFSGVKPSVKLTENGGGKNNPSGNNQFNDIDKDNKINKEVGQSDLTQRTKLGQSEDTPFKGSKYISNKYISSKYISSKEISGEVNNAKEEKKLINEKEKEILTKTTKNLTLGLKIENEDILKKNKQTLATYEKDDLCYITIWDKLLKISEDSSIDIKKKLSAQNLISQTKTRLLSEKQVNFIIDLVSKYCGFKILR
jgi:hypothetical protein